MFQSPVNDDFVGTAIETRSTKFGQPRLFPLLGSRFFLFDSSSLTVLFFPLFLYA